MLIENTGNFVWVNYDLNVTSDGVGERTIFSLFPKAKIYDQSGLEVVAEAVREYSGNEITLAHDTYEVEIPLTPVSGAKGIAIAAKVVEYDGTYYPDFVLKLDSIDSPPIYVREFIHIGMWNGLSKIYLSNPFGFNLKLKIFYYGDESVEQWSPENTYVLNTATSPITITHNVGYQPEVVCINSNGSKFTNFTTSAVDSKSATITFGASFTGKIVFQHIHTTDLTSASTVTITHNLNKYPGIIAINSSNQNIENFTVIYTNENSLTLTFSPSFTGKVKLY